MTDITIGGEYYDKVCGGCGPRADLEGRDDRRAGRQAPAPSTRSDIPDAEKEKDKDNGRDEGRDGDDDGNNGDDGGITAA